MCTYTHYEQHCRSCSRLMNIVQLRVTQCAAKMREQAMIKARINELNASAPASPTKPDDEVITKVFPASGSGPATPIKKSPSKRKVDDLPLESDDDEADPFGVAITSPPSAKRHARSPGQAGRGSAAPFGEPVQLFVDLDIDMDRVEETPAAVPEDAVTEMEIDGGQAYTYAYHSTTEPVDDAEIGVNEEIDTDVDMSTDEEDDEDEEMSTDEEDASDKEENTPDDCSEGSEEMELECIPSQEGRLEPDWGICSLCRSEVTME